MSGIAFSSGPSQATNRVVKHVYIIAGNYEQFNYYIKSLPLEKSTDTRYHYVSEEYQLRGIMEPEVILYGTYLNLPQWEDLHLQIKLCRGKVIAYE